GQWLDFILDRVLVTVCAVALLGGQYVRTGNPTYLFLCMAVVFLNLFHQLNGQIMAEALRRGEAETKRPSNESADGLADDRTLRDTPVLFARARTALARHRIRADVFSAIEFQAALFIFAPVTGLVVPLAAGACGLLLAFDIAGIARFSLRAAKLEKQKRETTARKSSSAPAQRSTTVG